MRSDFLYVPLDARGWRLSMGLRPLDLAQWLEFDEHFEDEIATKSALLADHYDEVVAVQPEGLDASEELYELVGQAVSERRLIRTSDRDEDEHPIVAASRLVQEDLCVLVRDDAWRLRAACVCFPSRWDLASKIGTTLDDIHRPVPLYEDELSRPTNAFFDRLRPDRSFWRLNWTLLDDETLHQPRSVRRPPRGDLDSWFFRVERQTLRQLPRTKAIVFTIRTYVTSAQRLRADDENFVPALLHALDTAPSSVQDYKGWRGVAQAIRATL